MAHMLFAQQHHEGSLPKQLLEAIAASLNSNSEGYWRNSQQLHKTAVHHVQSMGVITDLGWQFQCLC